MYRRPPRPDELYHFGRKGMKWYQHIFGPVQNGAKYSKSKEDDKSHITKTELIPKGSKLYRVTSKADEAKDGIKYMTFHDSDRNFYRSYGAEWIKQTNGLKDVNQLYEKTYVAKKDIKIPSTEHTYDVMKKVISQDVQNKIDAGKSFVEFEVLGKYSREMKDTLSDIYDGKKEVQKLLKDDNINKWYNLCYKPKVNDAIETMSGDDIPNAIMAMSAGFGTPRGTRLRNQVIDELKKEGYSAMTDFAGVGGHYGTPLETRQALILFDGNESINERYTAKLSDKKGSASEKEWYEWYKSAHKEHEKNSKKHKR